MGKVTNRFFDLMQPTIVKTSNEEELPEYLRNRYLINFNVLGIRYFDVHYILTETDDNIPYLVLKEDLGGIELECSPDDYEQILDIPRLYIDITEKFIKGYTNKDGKFITGSDLFQFFIFSAIRQNPIYVAGTSDFVAGKDYWVNSTLYNYLANTHQIAYPNFDARMPNYLDQNVHITKYFVDLHGSWQEDYTNLDYFEKKNRQRNNKYTDDQLKDLESTFCGEILEDTLIDDETRASDNNPLYDLVLNYFHNHQSDCASTAMNLVLNGLFATSYTSSCSCNSVITTPSANSASNYTQSCSDLYTSGMLLYLEQMLGDIKFYEDWMMIRLSEYHLEPNDVLVNNLIEMLKEFLDMDFNLCFSQQTNVHSSFNCNNTVSTAEGDKNRQTIENYIRVLEFVLDNNLVANKNKINLWGSAFGKLLPYLKFN